MEERKSSQVSRVVVTPKEDRFLFVLTRVGAAPAFVMCCVRLSKLWGESILDSAQDPAPYFLVVCSLVFCPRWVVRALLRRRPESIGSNITIHKKLWHSFAVTAKRLALLLAVVGLILSFCWGIVSAGYLLRDNAWTIAISLVGLMTGLAVSYGLAQVWNKTDRSIDGLLGVDLASVLQIGPTNFPRIWELFGWLLPRRTREKCFKPHYEELLEDYLVTRSKYRTPWAKRWIFLCFASRTLLMVADCFRVLLIDNPAIRALLTFAQKLAS